MPLTTPSTTDPLKALKSALDFGPNPVCIESFSGTNLAGGLLRSSNSMYSVPLTSEGVGELIVLIKTLASLDASDPPRPQEGKFSFDGRSFTVHYCPQVDGEILVVYR